MDGWNLKTMVWKMMFLFNWFNWVIFSFHVNLPGCTVPIGGSPRCAEMCNFRTSNVVLKWRQSHVASRNELPANSTSARFRALETMAFHSPTPQPCLHPLSDLKIFEAQRTTKIYESTWRFEKKTLVLESKSFSSGWWEPSPFKKFGAVVFFRELPSVSTDAFVPPFFRDLDLAANLDLKGVDWLMIDKCLKYLMVSGSRKHGKKSIGLSE